MAGLSDEPYPLRSQETTPQVTWMPQPTFRGTYGIFSLCVSTTIICVWSSIHKDIPTMRSTASRSFFYGVSWMVSALFCPEVFLFIALNQRTKAQAVFEQASRFLPVRKKSTVFNSTTTSLKEGSNKNVDAELDSLTEMGATDFREVKDRRRRHPFTLVHGFYASMGGYVFDFLDEDDLPAGHRFLPGGQTRMTITSMGARFLMKYDPDLIPDLSETSITDRSKASSLGKALLLAQLAWFCANCISRLAQGLPLSLLEVSTVAHGVCTLVTYGLWWHKPLNIDEPTPIRGEDAREACALMMMCSTEELHLLLGTICIRFPAELDSITTLDIAEANGNQLDGLHSIPTSVDAKTTTGGGPESLHAVLVPERQRLSGTDFALKRVSPRVTFQNMKNNIIFKNRPVPWYAVDRAEDPPVVLQRDVVNRWRLASRAMERYGIQLKDLKDMEHSKPYVSTRSTLQASSDSKGRNLRGIAISNLTAIGLTLTYGFPHFLGWNAKFPTPLEQSLWRVATVAVSLWGTGMALTVACIVSVRLALGNYTGERQGETGLVAFAALLYILAAGYLLVESLRQLLFLPPGAFELPAWTNYWPHFS